jgi:hypothetical protein
MIGISSKPKYARGEEVRLSHTVDAVTGLVIDVLPGEINTKRLLYVVALKNPLIDTADVHNRYTIQFLEAEELRPYVAESS